MANLVPHPERGAPLPVRWGVLGASAEPAAIWSPPVDLEKRDETWLVEADLPGLKTGEVIATPARAQSRRIDVKGG